MFIMKNITNRSYLQSNQLLNKDTCFISIRNYRLLAENTNVIQSVFL